MSLPAAPDVTFRPMRESDWPDVQRIYSEGIATGQATFEAEAPDWPRFDGSRLRSHRLVAEAPDDKSGRVRSGDWSATVPAIDLSDRHTAMAVPPTPGNPTTRRSPRQVRRCYP